MAEDALDKLESTKRSMGGGGDYAPWWTDDNFDIGEGDTLIGIVVEKHDYTDPGGDPHPVVTVRNVGRDWGEQGQEVSTPTRTGVEPLAERADVGDLVLIEYGGKTKANSGRDVHLYECSLLSQEEWQESEQADEFTEVWQASPHFDGDATAQSDDSDSMSEAASFAQDVLDMNDGSVTVDEMDNYLNEIRDYGVDVEEVVQVIGAEIDDDTVVA